VPTPAPSNVQTTHWMPADAFAASGYTHVRPELDFGMRWGEHETIRVSFAPFAERPGGYLYAYNRSTDQYLLLAPHTTASQVDNAWQEISDATASPDAYLAFASLDHGPGPMNLGAAQDLFVDCFEREVDAYRSYVSGATDGPARFDAAFNVIVQRSARVSSERLVLEAAHAASGDDWPVVVGYRILDETGWSGRLAGNDLDDACRVTSRAVDIADQHQLALQATSVSRGHTTLSAARVPELAFATVHREMVIGAPSVGI
jgi:hypothetical protein